MSFLLAYDLRLSPLSHLGQWSLHVFLALRLSLERLGFSELFRSKSPRYFQEFYNLVVKMHSKLKLGKQYINLGS